MNTNRLDQKLQILNILVHDCFALESPPADEAVFLIGNALWMSFLSPFEMPGLKTATLRMKAAHRLYLHDKEETPELLPDCSTMKLIEILSIIDPFIAWVLERRQPNAEELLFSRSADICQGKKPCELATVAKTLTEFPLKNHRDKDFQVSEDQVITAKQLSLASYLICEVRHRERAAMVMANLDDVAA